MPQVRTVHRHHSLGHQSVSRFLKMNKHAGYSGDVKRPLSEKDCNVDSQKVLNEGGSEPRLPKWRLTLCIWTYSSSSMARARSCRRETPARASMSHK